jgi:ribosomal-protein-alanine N-acetyltransferase
VLWYGDGADRQVVGRVTVDNIIRGVLQTSTLGYWVDREHLGRGLATSMVEFAVGTARQHGLHRVEAGTLLHNEPSQAVLRRAGFEQYGMAPKFLFIAGSWQDHALFQRILHDDPLGNPHTGRSVESP